MIESKPDFEPNIPNQGVIQCAGTTKHSVETSKTIFNNSFASNPKIGLPSAFKFPIELSLVLIFSTISKLGAKTKMCIFLTRPFLE